MPGSDEQIQGEWIEMKFDESFFQAGEINGFYVRSMVKRAWAAEMELMAIVDEICERHGIRWFVDWGTLLGTVREHGFIAWDDDIDIAMRRRDYEQFIKYAAQELPGECYLCNVRSDAQWQLTCSIRNAKGPHMEDAWLETWHGYPYAAAIDIYVYDNLPQGIENQRLYHSLIQALYHTAMSAERGKSFAECSQEVQGLATEIENVLGVKLSRERLLRGQLLSLTDQIAATYMNDEASDLIIASSYTGSPDVHFKAEWYAETIRMRFMDMMDVPVPVGYDKVLTTQYGDYMTPVRGGADHDYPVFKQMEQMLFDDYRSAGTSIPDFLKE